MFVILGRRRSWTHCIIFDYPFEILTYTTGYFGTTMLMGPTAIKSPTFYTTKTKYGPYGDEQGIFFSSCLMEGMIVGFHGRNGWYIDSIGVHVLEGKLSLPQTPSYPNRGNDLAVSEVNTQLSDKVVVARRGTGEEVVHRVVKEPVPYGPGPWGGDGGSRGSTRHGSSGDITHRVKLGYPNEVLHCISGYYNAVSRDGSTQVIKSLTFHTMRGKSGPFGEELGTYFTSNMTEGKVVGFHGRSGLYLDAIGVHTQRWLVDRKPNTKVFFSPSTSSKLASAREKGVDVQLTTTCYGSIMCITTYPSKY